MVEMIGSHGRRILLQEASLKQHGTSLNDELLITLLAEVESVVSSRPLTLETLSDIEIEAPLSTISLVTMKSNVFLLTPGDFK